MAQMHGAWLKCLRNGFTMLEMAYEFDKRFKYVGNDEYISEMADVFEKRLNYMGKYLTSFLNMWELTQRFWEIAKIFVK